MFVFRFWVKKKDVVPFDHNFEQNCKESNDREFEFSLNHVFQSTATTKLPPFGKGTLPKQYETRVADSVDDMKRAMGNAKWLEAFAKSRELHFQMHGGNEAAMAGQRSSNDVEESDVLEDVREEEPSPKKVRRTKGNLFGYLSNLFSGIACFIAVTPSHALQSSKTMKKTVVLRLMLEVHRRAR